LNKLKDFRKLFADTAITTTHLLKKCIKVEKLERRNDETGAKGLKEEDYLKEI